MLSCVTDAAWLVTGSSSVICTEQLSTGYGLKSVLVGQSFDHCLCYVHMCVVIRGGAPRIMDVGCVLSDSLGGAPVMVWACTPVRPVGRRRGANGGVYVGGGCVHGMRVCNVKPICHLNSVIIFLLYVCVYMHVSSPYSFTYWLLHLQYFCMHQ